MLNSDCTAWRPSFLLMLTPSHNPQASGPVAGKRWGEDTADSDWPEEYSIQSNIMLSSKSRVMEEGDVWFWGSCFFSLHLNCLHLHPWVSLLLFLLFSLQCHRAGESEQVAVGVLSCWPGSAHHNIVSPLVLHSFPFSFAVVMLLSTNNTFSLFFF